jgi:hypothetical protein
MGCKKMLPSLHQRIFFHQVCYGGMASRSQGDRIRTRALSLFSNESIGHWEVRSKWLTCHRRKWLFSLPIPEKCFERVKRMEFDDTLAVFSRRISNSTVRIEEFPRGINRRPWSTESNWGTYSLLRKALRIITRWGEPPLRCLDDCQTQSRIRTTKTKYNEFETRKPEKAKES